MLKDGVAFPHWKRLWGVGDCWKHRLGVRARGAEPGACSPGGDRDRDGDRDSRVLWLCPARVALPAPKEGERCQVDARAVPEDPCWGQGGQKVSASPFSCCVS